MPTEIYQCVECGWETHYGQYYLCQGGYCPKCGAPILTEAEMDQEDRDNAAQNADF